MSQYVVIKASRLYSGGPGYSGSSCKKAGVTPGLIYNSRTAAELDAARLKEVNPTGFVVLPYVDSKVARVINKARQVVDLWEKGDLAAAVRALDKALHELDGKEYKP